VNQSLLLHVVERLEGLAGKLPAGLQRPILNELTPLKELFLQQRSPRFLLTGSSKSPLSEIVSAFFLTDASEQPAQSGTKIHRWHDVILADGGKLSILDSRPGDQSNRGQIKEELERDPADLIFFLVDGDNARGPRKSEIENLTACLEMADKARPGIKVIPIALSAASVSAEHHERLAAVLETKPALSGRLLPNFDLPVTDGEAQARSLMTLLARELPNEARIEMVRMSRSREAQAEIAQLLVKSTTAVCTAVGAQPIPLADLPILTTLQLVMVSGIMYVSGRERNLRAAGEFVAALGANVGAGMLLREGTRAILKFFPGWGNIVCGAVAGAGTYAIGRAATVYFVDGLSIKDARRAYSKSRREPRRPRLLGRRRVLNEHPESNSPTN
jgi:uncharacterized protein (DUF697 family)